MPEPVAVDWVVGRQRSPSDYQAANPHASLPLTRIVDARGLAKEDRNMSISIKSGKEILPHLQQQLDNLQLDAKTHQTGSPTVFELRLQLPADPGMRALVQSSVQTALELATALSPNSGNSSFVGVALQQVFDNLPKSDKVTDLLVQIASVPVRVDYGPGSYGTGQAYKGSFLISEAAEKA